MILDRREFLKATAAAGLVAVLPASQADRSQLVVVDAGNAEGRLFARGLHGERVDAGLDPGPLMQMLSARWHADPMIVAGLTTDTTFVVLDTVLSSLGARLVLEGTHRFDDGRWRHRVRSAAALQHNLIAALAGSGNQWPAVLACAAHPASSAIGPAALECVSADCSQDRPARGHLVSWMFVPHATARAA